MKLINIMTLLHILREGATSPLSLAPDEKERRRTSEIILHLDKAIAHLVYISNIAH